MKKFLIGICIGLVIMMSCITVFVFASDIKPKSINPKYHTMINEAIEKSEYDIDQIDTDNIFVLENTSHINMKKNIDAIWVWVAMPIKDSSDISYVGFDKGEYIKAFTNFVSFDGMMIPGNNKYQKYISDNGLSEPTEIKNMWISERVHIFAFGVVCDNIEYIIPYYFTDESTFNIMKNDECNIELGKAYSIDEFVSLCEKESELYDVYRKEQHEKENKVIISVDKDGDENISVGNISIEEIKEDIIKHIDIALKESYIETSINYNSESYKGKYSYLEPDDKKEFKNFVQDLFDEISLQSVATNDEITDSDSYCRIRIKFDDNGKHLIYNTVINMSDDTIELRTQNHGSLILKVKNVDTVKKYMKESLPVQMIASESEADKNTDKETPENSKLSDTLEETGKDDTKNENSKENLSPKDMNDNENNTENQIAAKDAKECADILSDIGLFKGTDKGYELEKGLTREESATILVRLLGEDDYIADQQDAIFVDVDKNRWSYSYVMYCYKHNITRGTGTNTFSPEAEINAEEFVTLLIRLLGYHDVTPDVSLKKAVQYELLSEEMLLYLEKNDTFIREDMVQIVYNALNTKMSDGKEFSEYLIQQGVLTYDKINSIR